MSSYEDYQRTSKHYDATRRPVATDRVLGWLGRHRPVKELDVLDAGCGTGQFTEVLLPHVASVTGVDLNPGMLEVAAAKLGNDPRLSLQQGSIEELAFEDDRFDGAVINQVLHHLPDDAEWTHHRRVFAELHRVLRPGATFVLNTCAQAQLDHGYWYFRLMPQRPRDVMSSRYCPLPVVEELLRSVGFEQIERYAPLDAVIQAGSYHNSRGPLEQVWRDGDSTWASLTAEELEQSLARARSLDEAGELEAWKQLADSERPSVGQITLLAAR